MPNMDIPFQPLRNSLYTSLELMSGFDPERPLSAAETLDLLSDLSLLHRQWRRVPE